MRILVVVARDSKNPKAAGGDCHITLLAEALVAEGHSVSLWCSTDPCLPQAETKGGVEISRIAPIRLLAPAIWGRILLGQLRNFDLVIEDVIGGARLPFLAAVLGRRETFCFWFQDNRPLFQATYGRLMASVAGALQKILLVANRKSTSLTPSSQTRDWLLSMGYSPERVIVFPRLQPLPFEERGGLSFSAREDRFACIGNIRPLKRFERAVESLAILRRSRPTSRLTIVGRLEDSEYVASLKKLATTLHVEDAVEWRFDVPEAVKYDLLDSCKALTIHSPIEGLGWTVVEAGVCGVPSVVGPGVPTEVVIDGVNGLRLSGDDPEDFSSALERLLFEEQLWSRLSQGARIKAKSLSQPRRIPELTRAMKTVGAKV